MPSPVYEDDKIDSAAPGQHDDLGVPEDEKRKEIAGLEDDFANPSAKEPQDQESKQLGSSIGLGAKTEGGQPSLYRPSAGLDAKSALSGYRPTKKQGGILGSFLAIFIAIVVGLNSLGPLQFIHFAQMLQAFHFSDQENDSNSRVKKLLVYAKTKNVNSTRIGLIANAQAKKIDAKFASNGWEIKSSGGTFDGFEYDPAKNAGTEAEKKGRPTIDEMRTQLESGGVKPDQIKLSADGKTLKVNADSVKYWSNKSLIKSMYTGSGNRDVGKITAAFEKRILIKRAGLSFNPLTKLDQKVNKAFAEKIKEERSKRLKGQSTPVEISAKGEKDNPNATPEEKAAAAQSQAEAEAANKTVEEAKGGKLNKAALSGIGGVAFVCVVRGIATSIDKGRALNAQIPMMQASAEVLGVGSKSQDGGDTSMSVLGEYSKSLYGRSDTNKSSWSSASTIQYEQGKANTGGKLPDELNPSPGGTALSEFFNKDGIKQALDAACPVLDSTFVTILSIATGIKKAFDIAVNAAVLAAGPAIISALEAAFVGDVPDLSDPKYAGAVYGEAANVGSRMVANETSASMGGRPLTSTEEIALRNDSNQTKAQDDKMRSIADRYLSPYSYDTPVAAAMDNINTGNISATVAHIPQLFLATIISPFSKGVKAATSETPDQAYYGIKKVGFSSGSLDKVENPYKNADQVVDILKRKPDLITKLSDCNHITATLTPDLNFDSQQGTGENPAIMGSYDELVKLGCPVTAADDQKDPDFFKVRVAAFDTMAMKSFSCVEFDDEQSCSEMGLGPAPTNNTGGTVVGISGWVWPIKKETLDNPSGAGLNQCWLHYHVKGDGTAGYHAALDIDVTYKPVYAANSGKVIKKASDGYATLIIQHDGGFYSVYEHMSSISVSVGDSVTAGQQIGVSGEVGAPGAPHLHFGISTSATGDNWGTYANPWYTVNPLDFLPNDYSPALLKDDSTGSCLTKDIKTRSDFGWSLYQTKGQYAPYKN